MIREVINNGSEDPEKNSHKREINLSARLSLIIFTILFLSTAIQTYQTVLRENRAITEAMLSEKRLLAETLVKAFFPKNDSSHREDEWEIIKTVAEDPYIYYCRIVKASGEIYLSNLPDEIGTILTHEAAKTSKLYIMEEYWEGEKIQVIIAPSLYRDCTLWLGFSLKGINLALQTNIKKNLFISIPIILIITVLVFVTSRKLIIPLKKMAEGAKMIGKGNLDYKVYVNRKDELGNLARAINSMTTDLKLSTVSIEFFNNLINNIKDALVLFDDERIITMINPAVTTLTDYKAKELEGKSIQILFRHNESPLTAELFKALDKGEECLMECNIRTKENRMIPVLFSLSRMQDRGRQLFIFTARDITNLKQSEIKLNNLNKKLSATTHQAGMAQIGLSFLHSISNTLTNMLISLDEIKRVTYSTNISYGLRKAHKIIMGEEGNLNKFFTEEKKGKLLNRYYLQIARLLDQNNRIINKEISLLHRKIAEIEKVIKNQEDFISDDNFEEPINITHFLNTLLTASEDKLKKENITLEKVFQIDKNLCVHISKTKLTYIIESILKNAYQALMYTDNPEKRITLILRQDNIRLWIIINDNGIGFTEEAQEKIFHLGYSTKEASGYSLHNCADFIHNSRGNITAHSDGHNKGASLIIELPYFWEEE